MADWAPWMRPIPSALSCRRQHHAGPCCCNLNKTILQVFKALLHSTALQAIRRSWLHVIVSFAKLTSHAARAPGHFCLAHIRKDQVEALDFQSFGQELQSYFTRDLQARRVPAHWRRGHLLSQGRLYQQFEQQGSLLCLAVRSLRPACALDAVVLPRAAAGW